MSCGCDYTKPKLFLLHIAYEIVFLSLCVIMLPFIFLEMLLNIVKIETNIGDFFDDVIFAGLQDIHDWIWR